MDELNRLIQDSLDETEYTVSDWLDDVHRFSDIILSHGVDDGTFFYIASVLDAVQLEGGDSLSGADVFFSLELFLVRGEEGGVPLYVQCGLHFEDFIVKHLYGVPVQLGFFHSVLVCGVQR